jgi:hypothetical protein
MDWPAFNSLLGCGRLKGANGAALRTVSGPTELGRWLHVPSSRAAAILASRFGRSTSTARCQAAGWVTARQERPAPGLATLAFEQPDLAARIVAGRVWLPKEVPGWGHDWLSAEILVVSGEVR